MLVSAEPSPHTFLFVLGVFLNVFPCQAFTNGRLTPGGSRVRKPLNAQHCSLLLFYSTLLKWWENFERRRPRTKRTMTRTLNLIFPTPLAFVCVKDLPYYLCHSRTRTLIIFTLFIKHTCIKICEKFEHRRTKTKRTTTSWRCFKFCKKLKKKHQNLSLLLYVRRRHAFGNLLTITNHCSINPALLYKVMG